MLCALISIALSFMSVSFSVPLLNCDESLCGAFPSLTWSAWKDLDTWVQLSEEDGSGQDNISFSSISV